MAWATAGLRRHVVALSAVGIVCCGLINSGGVDAAETLIQRQRAADETIREALQREVYGLDADRRELLATAARTAPDYAPTMWQRGYVRDEHNHWVKFADLIQHPLVSRKMTSYEKMQAACEESVTGHLAAAEWCDEHKLPEQRRAHLYRVLDFERDHPFARAELGFVRAAGDWKSQQQIDEEEQLAADEATSLAKYGKEFDEIRKGFAARSQARQAAAREKLLAIRDVAAIPALESILSPLSDEAALAVIENVAAISDPKASLSLARHAVYYPTLAVREAAAEKLKARDAFTFMPQLLSMMYSPVTSQFVATRLPNGSLGYRHAFIREGQEKKELLVLDTSYDRLALPNGDGSLFNARAASQARSTARDRERAAQAQNVYTTQLNDRIGWVLKTVTGEDLPAVPADWWTWWNNYNEVEQVGEKYVAYLQEQRSVAIVDEVVTSSGGSGPPVGTMSECLIAGTPIWTISGPRPIEKIRAGDLVLSQNVETGELAYKPVLRATTRPKGKTIQFTAGGETFESSGGHVFWVAGQGWRKSSQLQSGMVLHSVQQPVRVSTVGAGAEAETYNLIVADFNSYFVGNSMILSHDFTQRQPTRTIVPGLKAE